MIMAPNGYTRLPEGIGCRCVNLWSEPDGIYWCCNRGSAPVYAPIDIDPDARRLKTALGLYERFCSDLTRDAGMARSRLIAGIQVALRNELPSAKD